MDYPYRLITPLFARILVFLRETMRINSINSESTLAQSGLFNRKQIADYIGVSERTVSNMVRQRRIPVIKFGKSVRFDLTKVNKALEKYEIEEI